MRFRAAGCQQQTLPIMRLCTEIRQQKRKIKREKKNPSFIAFVQQSRRRVDGFEYVCYAKCKGQLISDSPQPPEVFCISDAEALSTDLLEAVKRKDIFEPIPKNRFNKTRQRWDSLTHHARQLALLQPKKEFLMFLWPSVPCKSLYQILWHLVARQGNNHLQATLENCHFT